MFQSIHLSYTERAAQTSDPDVANGSGGEGGPPIYKGRAPRRLVPQETYKPARQQKELEGPEIIEFFVWGKKGVRLSDALEGNWVGFNGRDDRSLFSGDRLQIMIRLQVRLVLLVVCIHL